MYDTVTLNVKIRLKLVKIVKMRSYKIM